MYRELYKLSAFSSLLCLLSFSAAYAFEFYQFSFVLRLAYPSQSIAAASIVAFFSVLLTQLGIKEEGGKKRGEGLGGTEGHRGSAGRQRKGGRHILCI